MQLGLRHFGEASLTWFKEKSRDPSATRWSLARGICEREDWRNRQGEWCSASACKALPQLAAHLGVTLPAARPVASVRAPASDYPDLALDCALEELGEVSVRRVAAKDVGAFRRLLHTHHPLGWDRSPGAALNCWIVSSRQGRLGGVRWSAAGWHQACRDRWIGWSEAARVAHLQAVVRQSRFLILPGVRVPNLASHVLAKASKVLAAEWRRAHGTAPISQTQLHASIVNITPLLSNVSNCKARVRLDEQLFKTLHQAILKVVFDAEGRSWHARKVRPDTDRRWQGHHVFAVDGTCLNLPRGLVHEGWRTPVDGAHYPQGLVSCLYRLQSRLPVDFDLHAHGNERAAALAHLNVLSANDGVVYDRGYYAYEMLHAVFRMQRKTGIDVDRFIHGSRRDTVIEVVPRQGTLTRLRRRNPGATFGPHRLRLVQYAVGDTVFILGTTLLDRDQYSIDQLSDLYHASMGHRGTVQGIQTADGG